MLTVVERDGRPAVAVIHDAQLAEEPELVHAAGAVALLARRTPSSRLAWTDSLRQLRESRARIAAAGEVERRALERDLHDGAQQQLTALLRQAGARRRAGPARFARAGQLAGLATDLEHTLEELRRLAHGIYPAPLADAGLVRRARGRRARAPAARSRSRGGGIGRYPPAIESAVYYCCLEARAERDASTPGPGAGIAIRLREAGAELRFEVRDDGPGFDPAAAHDGVGPAQHARPPGRASTAASRSPRRRAAGRRGRGTVPVA